MNWLSFVEELKLNISNLCDESLEELLEDLIRFIHNSDLTNTEKNYANQSYQAFLAVRKGVSREDQEIVTESESNNPEDWGSLERSNSRFRSTTQQNP